MLPADATLKMLPAEAMLRMLPADASDRIEPAEATERIEPVEANDWMEPTEAPDLTLAVDHHERCDHIDTSVFGSHGAVGHELFDFIRAISRRSQHGAGVRPEVG